MSDAPVIDARELTVRLDGRAVVDHVSFTVPAHQTTAIIGPNGAGKSVLLRALLRLLPIEHGTVTFWGTDQAYFRRFASRLSYIPQRLTFDRAFPLTVAGLFALKSRRFIGMRADERDHMLELLRLVGMQDSLHARIVTLSGGQLQRVLVAYSLMNKPELLILDEPAAGIDSQGQETMYALLERIQQRESLTLLLVSHELDVVMRYATQVLCLNQQLLCAGVPQQTLTADVLSQMYGSSAGHFHHTHSA